jgi:hypothetical protein
MDLMQDLSSLTSGLNDFMGKISGIGSPPKFNSIFGSDFTQNRYLEQGYFTKSSFNDVDVHRMKTIWQVPTATIIVKKRMFSSLGEYNQVEYMDSDERVFINASKRLFANKCKQIAHLEQLTKINEMVSQSGKLHDALLPVVISAVDNLTALTANNGFDRLNSGLLDAKKYTDQLKELMFYSGNFNHTTWMSENTAASSNLINDAFAHETGVIELTNFTSFTTTTSLNLGSGNATIEFADPYHLAEITESDIELAISDVMNSSSGLNPLNNPSFNFAVQYSSGMASDLTGKLNALRRIRGASSITFKQYPNGQRKIVVILDRNGQEIYFTEPSLLEMSDVVVDSRFTDTANNDHLTPDEVQLFSAIIRNIINYNTMAANFQSSAIKDNQKSNYIRRKMWNNFLGKHIVQSNDLVYVYINSRTKYDPETSAPVANFASLISDYQQGINNLKNTFNGIFNPSSDLNTNLEREIYASKDFPSYLWMMFRNYFVNDSSGTCVFAGLVNNPTSAYSQNRYSFSFSATEMSKYFEFGQLNFNPGVQTDNGTLLDPLTPYKTRFDQVSDNYSNNPNDYQLLDDNIKLLSTGMLKFKNGPQFGDKATSRNLIQDSQYFKVDDGTIIKKGTKSARIMYGPDGLVYKWKEGIGSHVQFGTSIGNDPTKVGSVSVTQDPFAKQDPFNTISLLITGKPYDYASYFDHTVSLSDDGKPASDPYYTSLLGELQKRNVTWGNFQPYKTMYLNESQTKSLVLKQKSISNNQDKIDADLNQISELQIQSMMADATSEVQNLVRGRIERIKLDIDNRTKSITDALKSDSQNIVYSGNKVSIADSDPAVSKQLRRKMNSYTRRLSHKVRANKDVNLFIVDDNFDKDPDIVAFNQDLAGSIAQYSSNGYTTVRDKIKYVSEVMNLELFCDSQGNIQLRTPQYNRIPSSVFMNQLRRKRETGIQIYPQFIDDLVTNKVKYNINLIEAQEGYVRILCALLGHDTDKKCAEFLSSGASGNATLFSFLSSEPDGSNKSSTIGSLDKLILEKDPTRKLYLINDTLDKVNSQSKLNNLYTVVQRYKSVDQFMQSNDKRTITPQSNQNTADSLSLTSDRMDALQTDILVKTGQRFLIDDYLNTKLGSLALTSSVAQIINVIKVTKDISDHLTIRQSAVSALYGALKNTKDSISLNTNQNDQMNILFQHTNNADIPPAFEGLVEDENYDDIGAGSGSRYVIKQEHILSMAISEREPEITSICVTGQLSGFQSINVDTGSYSALGNSNTPILAEAVDYDMWRMYGYRSGSPIQVPYFRDAKKHCAPYAIMKLNMQRKDLQNGTITIVGNEFMQIGDVVFIEPKNKLFYIQDVQQRYSFGSFTTTLTLKYGHVAGEYIPVPYDIIGKALYNNQYESELCNVREENSAGEIALGALVSIATDSNSEYTDHNEEIIKRILNQAAVFTNRATSADSNIIVVPRVQLRYYVDRSIVAGSSTYSIFNSTEDILDFANSISSILLGNMPNKAKNAHRLSLNKIADDGNPTIKVEPIDLNNRDEKRGPSKYALSYAKTLANNVKYRTNNTVKSTQSYTSNKNLTSAQHTENEGAPDVTQQLPMENVGTSKTSEVDQVKLALMNYVIDVFVVFETTLANVKST